MTIRLYCRERGMRIVRDIRTGLHLRAERIRCEVYAQRAQAWIDFGAPDDRYPDHLGADRLAWANLLDTLAGHSPDAGSAA